MGRARKSKRRRRKSRTAQARKPQPAARYRVLSSAEMRALWDNADFHHLGQLHCLEVTWTTAHKFMPETVQNAQALLGGLWEHRVQRCRSPAEQPTSLLLQRLRGSRLSVLPERGSSKLPLSSASLASPLLTCLNHGIILVGKDL